MFNKSRLFKITSWIALTAFIYSFVIHEPLLAITTIVHEQNAAEAVRNKLESFVLPYKFGRFMGGAFANSQKLVVYIQDLHCHPEVQKNIYEILRLFDNRYNVKRIFVEGAPAGKVDTSILGSISDEKIKKKAMTTLLDKGLLSGAEYYSIVDNKDKLYGLEQWDIYEKNLARIQKLIAGKQANVALADELVSRVEDLKSENLSPSLKKLEHKLSHSTQDYLSLEKLAQKTNEDISDYRNLSQYINMLKLNSEIKFNRLPNELTEYVVELKKVLPYSIYKTLLDKLSNNENTEDYYLALAEISKEYTPQLSIRYPNVGKFLEYIRLNYTINPIYLVSEEKAFGDRILARNAQTMMDRELLLLSRMSRICRNLVDLKVTTEEYEYFKQTVPRFRVLLQKYIPYEEIKEILVMMSDKDLYDFFETNLTRNDIFLENIAPASSAKKSPSFPKQTNMSFQKQTNMSFPNVPVGNPVVNSKVSTTGYRYVLENLDKFDDIEIAVTGGFHSEIVKTLKDKNISYLAITPNVTQDFNDSIYERVLTNKITPQDIIKVSSVILSKAKDLALAAIPSPQYHIATTFSSFPGLTGGSSVVDIKSLDTPVNRLGRNVILSVAKDLAFFNYRRYSSVASSLRMTTKGDGANCTPVCKPEYDNINTIMAKPHRGRWSGEGNQSAFAPALISALISRGLSKEESMRLVNDLMENQLLPAIMEASQETSEENRNKGFYQVFPILQGFIEQIENNLPEKAEGNKLELKAEQRGNYIFVAGNSQWQFEVSKKGLDVQKLSGESKEDSASYYKENTDSKLTAIKTYSLFNLFAWFLGKLSLLKLTDKWGKNWQNSETTPTLTILLFIARTSASIIEIPDFARIIAELVSKTIKARLTGNAMPKIKDLNSTKKFLNKHGPQSKIQETNRINGIEGIIKATAAGIIIGIVVGLSPFVFPALMVNSSFLIAHPIAAPAISLAAGIVAGGSIFNALSHLRYKIADMISGRNSSLTTSVNGDGAISNYLTSPDTKRNVFDNLREALLKTSDKAEAERLYKEILDISEGSLTDLQKAYRSILIEKQYPNIIKKLESKKKVTFQELMGEFIVKIMRGNGTAEEAERILEAMRSMEKAGELDYKQSSNLRSYQEFVKNRFGTNFISEIVLQGIIDKTNSGEEISSDLRNAIQFLTFKQIAKIIGSVNNSNNSWIKLLLALTENKQIFGEGKAINETNISEMLKLILARMGNQEKNHALGYFYLVLLSKFKHIVIATSDGKTLDQELPVDFIDTMIEAIDAFPTKLTRAVSKLITLRVADIKSGAMGYSRVATIGSVRVSPRKHTHSKVMKFGGINVPVFTRYLHEQLKFTIWHELMHKVSLSSGIDGKPIISTSVWKKIAKTSGFAGYLLMTSYGIYTYVSIDEIPDDFDYTKLRNIGYNEWVRKDIQGNDVIYTNKKPEELLKDTIYRYFVTNNSIKLIYFADEGDLGYSKTTPYEFVANAGAEFIKGEYKDEYINVIEILKEILFNRANKGDVVDKLSNEKGNALVKAMGGAISAVGVVALLAGANPIPAALLMAGGLIVVIADILVGKIMKSGEEGKKSQDKGDGAISNYPTTSPKTQKEAKRNIKSKHSKRSLGDANHGSQLLNKYSIIVLLSVISVVSAIAVYLMRVDKSDKPVGTPKIKQESSISELSLAEKEEKLLSLTKDMIGGEQEVKRLQQIIDIIGKNGNDDNLDIKLDNSHLKSLITLMDPLLKIIDLLVPDNRILKTFFSNVNDSCSLQGYGVSLLLKSMSLPENIRLVNIITSDHTSIGFKTDRYIVAIDYALHKVIVFDLRKMKKDNMSKVERYTSGDAPYNRYDELLIYPVESVISNLLGQKGFVHAKVNDLANAATYIQGAIDENIRIGHPEANVLHYLNLSFVLGSLPGKDSKLKALGAAKEAEKIIPDHYHVNNIIGLTYRELARTDPKQLNLAIEYFGKTIEIAPNFVAAYFSLSKIYVELKDFKKARDILVKTIKIIPNEHISYYMIAQTYIAEKNYPKALDFLKKSLSKCKDDRICAGIQSEIVRLERYNRAGSNKLSNSLTKAVLFIYIFVGLENLSFASQSDVAAPSYGMMDQFWNSITSIITPGTVFVIAAVASVVIPLVFFRGQIAAALKNNPIINRILTLIDSKVNKLRPPSIFHKTKFLKQVVVIINMCLALAGCGQYVDDVSEYISDHAGFEKQPQVSREHHDELAARIYDKYGVKVVDKGLEVTDENLLNIEYAISVLPERHRKLLHEIRFISQQEMHDRSGSYVYRGFVESNGVIYLVAINIAHSLNLFLHEMGHIVYLELPERYKNIIEDEYNSRDYHRFDLRSYACNINKNDDEMFANFYAAWYYNTKEIVNKGTTVEGSDMIRLLTGLFSEEIDIFAILSPVFRETTVLFYEVNNGAVQTEQMKVVYNEDGNIKSYYATGDSTISDDRGSDVYLSNEQIILTLDKNPARYSNALSKLGDKLFLMTENDSLLSINLNTINVSHVRDPNGSSSSLREGMFNFQILPNGTLALFDVVSKLNIDLFSSASNEKIGEIRLSDGLSGVFLNGSGIFSYGGRLIAAGMMDSSKPYLRAYDISDASRIVYTDLEAELEPDKNLEMRFSSDGNSLYLIAHVKTSDKIRVLQFNNELNKFNLKSEYTLDPSAKYIYADDGVMVSQEVNLNEGVEVLKIWNADGGTLIRELKVNIDSDKVWDSPAYVAKKTDNNLYIVSRAGGSIYIVDAVTGNTGRVNTGKDSFSAVAFDDESNKAYFWRVIGNKPYITEAEIRVGQNAVDSNNIKPSQIVWAAVAAWLPYFGMTAYGAFAEQAVSSDALNFAATLGLLGICGLGIVSIFGLANWVAKTFFGEWHEKALGERAGPMQIGVAFKLVPADVSFLRVSDPASGSIETNLFLYKLIAKLPALKSLLYMTGSIAHEGMHFLFPEIKGFRAELIAYGAGQLFPAFLGTLIGLALIGTVGPALAIAATIMSTLIIAGTLSLLILSLTSAKVNKLRPSPLQSPLQFWNSRPPSIFHKTKFLKQVVVIINMCLALAGCGQYVDDVSEYISDHAGFEKQPQVSREHHDEYVSRIYEKYKVKVIDDGVEFFDNELLDFEYAISVLPEAHRKLLHEIRSISRKEMNAMPDPHDAFVDSEGVIHFVVDNGDTNNKNKPGFSEQRRIWSLRHYNDEEINTETKDVLSKPGNAESANALQIFLHEMGHVIHPELADKYKKIIEKEYSSKNYTRFDLRSYASNINKNDHEMFANFYAAWFYNSEEILNKITSVTSKDAIILLLTRLFSEEADIFGILTPPMKETTVFCYKVHNGIVYAIPTKVVFSEDGFIESYHNASEESTISNANEAGGRTDEVKYLADERVVLPFAGYPDSQYTYSISKFGDMLFIIDMDNSLSSFNLSTNDVFLLRKAKINMRRGLNEGMFKSQILSNGMIAWFDENSSQNIDLISMDSGEKAGEIKLTGGLSGDLIEGKGIVSYGDKLIVAGKLNRSKPYLRAYDVSDVSKIVYTDLEAELEPDDHLSMRFSYDGMSLYLIARGKEDKIRVLKFDNASNKFSKISEYPMSPTVKCIYADDKVMVSKEVDGNEGVEVLKIWNAESGIIIRELKANIDPDKIMSWPTYVAKKTDNKLFIVSRAGASIYDVDVVTGKTLRIDTGEDPFSAVTFDEQNNKVYLWRVIDNKSYITEAEIPNKLTNERGNALIKAMGGAISAVGVVGLLAGANPIPAALLMAGGLIVIIADILVGNIMKSKEEVKKSKDSSLLRFSENTAGTDPGDGMIKKQFEGVPDVLGKAFNPSGGVLSGTNLLIGNEVNPEERIDNKTALLVVPAERAGEVDGMVGQRAGIEGINFMAVTLDNGQDSSGLAALDIRGDEGRRNFVEMPVIDGKGNYEKDESGNIRMVGIVIKASYRKISAEAGALYMSPADNGTALHGVGADGMIKLINDALGKLARGESINNVEAKILEEFLARCAVTGIIDEIGQKGPFKQALEELGFDAAWAVETSESARKIIQKITIDRDGPYNKTVFGDIDEKKMSKKDYQEMIGSFITKIRDSKEYEKAVEKNQGRCAVQSEASLIVENGVAWGTISEILKRAMDAGNKGLVKRLVCGIFGEDGKIDPLVVDLVAEAEYKKIKLDSNAKALIEDIQNLKKSLDKKLSPDDRNKLESKVFALAKLVMGKSIASEKTIREYLDEIGKKQLKDAADKMAANGQTFVLRLGDVTGQNRENIKKLIVSMLKVVSALHIDITSLDRQEAESALNEWHEIIIDALEKNQIQGEAKIMVVANLRKDKNGEDDIEVIKTINSLNGFEAYVKLDVGALYRQGMTEQELLTEVKAGVKRIKDSGASPQTDTQGLKEFVEESKMPHELITKILKAITESGVDAIAIDLGGKKDDAGNIDLVPYVDVSEAFDVASLVSIFGWLLKGSRKTTVTGLFNEGRHIGRSRAKESMEKGQAGFTDSLFAESETGQTIASAISDMAHDAVNAQSTDKEWYKAQAAGIVNNIRAAGLEQLFKDAINEAIAEINTAEDINAQKANIAKLGALVYGAAAEVLISRSGVDAASDKLKAQEREALENYLFERAREMIYRNGKLNAKLSIEEIIQMLPGAVYLYNAVDREKIIDKIWNSIGKEQWLLKFKLAEAVKRSGNDALWGHIESRLKGVEAPFREYFNGRGRQELGDIGLVYWVNYLKIMHPKREKLNEWDDISKRIAQLSEAANENEIKARDDIAFTVLHLSLGEMMKDYMIKNLLDKGKIPENVRESFFQSQNPYVRRAAQRLKVQTADQAEINIKAVVFKGDKPYMISNRAKDNDEATNAAIADLLNGLPPITDRNTRELVEKGTKASFKLARRILTAG